MNPDRLTALAALLRRRRAIVADHDWRDRDATGHLDALKSVSQEIDAVTGELGAGLPPRLDHFLRQSSFDKALAFIESSMVR
jgi:hypothetical protein